ncbi:MAG: hypothetical protein ACRD43_09625 [Pyrinomonadaceae bacterium]
MLTKIKDVFVDSAAAFKALMIGENGASVETDHHTITTRGKLNN